MAYVTPGTVASGDVATAAAWNVLVGNDIDIDTYVAPIRTGWVDYTPTLAQGASTNIAKTVTYSKYIKTGKLVIWVCFLEITGSGTGGSTITVTLPVTSAIANTVAVGGGKYFDASVQGYACTATLETTTLLSLTADSNNGGRLGNFPNIAAAVNDQFTFTAIYPAA